MAHPVDHVAERAAQRSASGRATGSFCARPSSARSQQRIATLTTSASSVKNQRCQPPARARKLNAAPVLCARTMSSTGSTVTDSCSAKRVEDPFLRELVQHDRDQRDRQPAPAANARQPARPQTWRRAPAGRRRCRRSARTAPDAPDRCPTSSVRCQQRTHFVPPLRCADSHTPGITALPVSAATAPVRRRLHLVHACRRGDGQEPQLIAERRERAALVGQRVDIHLGLQRRADGAGLAQLLEFALHGLRAAAISASQSMRRGRHGRELRTRWRGTPTSDRSAPRAGAARSPRR